MEKLDVTAEKRNQVHKLIGGYSCAYKHNDAEVFIKLSHHDDENKYGYAAQATVCVMKNDKYLIFSADERVGNEYGTVFTHATVMGLADRLDVSEDASAGLYPYSSSTKEELDGHDILTRAAKIYSRYDKETNGDIKIGELFKSYVPGRYADIQNELSSIEESKKLAQKKEISMKQIQSFKETMRGF